MCQNFTSSSTILSEIWAVKENHGRVGLSRVESSKVRSCWVIFKWIQDIKKLVIVSSLYDPFQGIIYVVDDSHVCMQKELPCTLRGHLRFSRFISLVIICNLVIIFFQYRNRLYLKILYFFNNIITIFDTHEVNEVICHEVYGSRHMIINFRHKLQVVYLSGYKYHVHDTWLPLTSR